MLLTRFFSFSICLTTFLLILFSWHVFPRIVSQKKREFFFLSTIKKHFSSYSAEFHSKFLKNRIFSSFLRHFFISTSIIRLLLPYYVNVYHLSANNTKINREWKLRGKSKLKIPSIRGSWVVVGRGAWIN